MKDKHCISIYADEEEERRLEYLKPRYGVKTHSAVLRAAIVRESDREGFNLPTNAPSGAIKNIPPTTEGKGR